MVTGAEDRGVGRALISYYRHRTSQLSRHLAMRCLSCPSRPHDFAAGAFVSSRRAAYQVVLAPFGGSAQKFWSCSILNV